jgi:NAD(P)-dependent dehydrogenase (short-subunit alcohol dehydrogenase family)
MSQVVLITGCSSGIGRDLALRLSQAGYDVAATARNAAALAELPAALKLSLDVTRPESVSEAVECVLEHFGRIDALINNAGYAIYGAAEEISDQQLHAMFDVNVFGVMRMVRAVAPVMRAQRSGRIINVSSIVGRLATPANGAYSASKFALEALSDALRLELEPFGVRVVVVEPGSVKTNFSDAAQARAQAILSNPLSPYRALYGKFQQATAGMRQDECGSQVVSRVIQGAIEAPRPKARYLAGFPLSGRLVMALRDVLWDPVVRSLFKMSPAAD